MELPDSLRNLAKIKAYIRREVQKQTKEGDEYRASEVDMVDFDIFDILQVHDLEHEIKNLPLLYYTIVALATESRNLYDDLHTQYLTWESIISKEAATSMSGRPTELALAQVIQTHPDYMQKRYELNAAKKLWRTLWFGAKTAVEIKVQILSAVNPESRAKLEKMMDSVRTAATEVAEAKMEDADSMFTNSDSMDPPNTQVEDGDSIPPDPDEKEGIPQRPKGEMPREKKELGTRKSRSNKEVNKDPKLPSRDRVSRLKKGG